jgi:hypothetical protein
MKAHQNQLASDPNFDSTFDQLIDATAVTTMDASMDQAKITAQRQFFSPTSRRAFVATDPSIFGMGRFMEAYHDMGQQRERASVFRDRESALKWLNLKDDSAAGR